MHPVIAWSPPPPLMLTKLLLSVTSQSVIADPVGPVSCARLCRFEPVVSLTDRLYSPAPEVALMPTTSSEDDVLVNEQPSIVMLCA